MHDKLFANQRALKEDNLVQYATDLSLDLDAFSTCLVNPEIAKSIRADMALAARIGVRGTPNFWIGVRDANDPNKARLVRNLRGAMSFDQFKTVLDPLLQE